MLSLGVPASAATIIQTGPTYNGFAAYNINANETHEVGFQINDAYANVQVYANLSGGNNTSPVDGTVYLTTQIGPGTTVVNEIASSPFSVSWFAPQEMLLISIPYLPAGQYFLTIGSTSTTASVNWEATAFLTNNFVAPDAVDLGFGRANTGNVALYPPASSFVDAQSQDVMYRVTGDIAAPEPSAFWLLGVAIPSLVRKRRRNA